MTAAGRAGEGIGAIVAHRICALRAQDLTVHRGIPTTTVARTIFDLARSLDAHRLRRAIDRAEINHRFDAARLYELMERHPRRPGVPRLRELLADYAEPALTRSGLEDLLLAALNAAGLPRPLTNGWIAVSGGEGYSPDLLWPEAALIVEADGRRLHTSPVRRDADARRDRRLQLCGYTVLRFTDVEITRCTHAVVAEIAEALRRHGTPRQQQR